MAAAKKAKLINIENQMTHRNENGGSKWR